MPYVILLTGARQKNVRQEYLKNINNSQSHVSGVGPCTRGEETLGCLYIQDRASL